MDLATFRRLIAPLQRRVALMIGRCVLTAVNDAAKMQRVQVSALRDEVRENVERMQEYGFTSVPLAGAEGVAIFIAGNRGHGVVVATDDRRYRPKGWEDGEVGMYDWLGKFIRLRGDGTLHISAPRILIEAENEIVAEAPHIEITAGDDIVQAAPRIEVAADEDLRLYAAVSWRWDVAGYAEQLDAIGVGTWQFTNWKTGATVLAPVDLAIQPPRVADA